jgi:cytochrome c
MVFAGIKDAKSRADLIAFLEAVSTGRMAAPDSHGMMSGEVPPLKQLEPGQRVVAIRYCDHNYSVTMASGDTQVIWERNLRFKTDSSETGPQAGQPALMPAGSMGDRASIIFAAPAEISAFIEVKC